MLMTEEELSLRKEQLDLQEQRIQLDQQRLSKKWYRDPLILGIVAAFLGLIGTLATSVYNGAASVRVEKEKLSNDLIKIALASENPTTRAENLMEFLEMGLIFDPDGTIRDRAENYIINPLQAPNLSERSGALFDTLPGPDETYGTLDDFVALGSMQLPRKFCGPVQISGSKVLMEIVGQTLGDNCGIIVAKDGVNILVQHRSDVGDNDFSFGPIAGKFITEQGRPAQLERIEIVSLAGIAPTALNELICMDSDKNVVSEVTFGDGATGICEGKEISSFELKTNFSVAIRDILVE